MFPTCVNFNMLVKRIPLCKCSEANFTFKRLGSGMYSIMVFQVLLRGKALPTCFTHKRPFPYSQGESEKEKTKECFRTSLGIPCKHRAIIYKLNRSMSKGISMGLAQGSQSCVIRYGICLFEKLYKAPLSQKAPKYPQM